MVWSPSKAATDIRPLSPNLLAYIATNQTAALRWANGNLDGLVNFAVIYNTDEGSHQNSIFPNLQVFGERHNTRFGDDGLHVEYSLAFIYEITGTDATQLRKDAKKYGYALESMIVNIPDTALMNGVSDYLGANIEELSVDHNPLIKGEEANWMIASFLRVTFKFWE
jgi:hypothetical protein